MKLKIPSIVTSLVALVLLTTGVSAASAAEWKVATTPNPSETTGNVLRDLACPQYNAGTGVNACIAVGNSTTSGGGSKPLIELGGSAGFWNVWPGTPPPTEYPGAVLEAISCSTETFCQAVGYYVPKAGTRRPLAEHWTGGPGEKWVFEKPAIPGTDEFTELLGISCTSPTNCRAVGSTKASSGAASTQTLIERWNGSSWSVEKSANPATENRLYDVSCVSSTACMAVGNVGANTSAQVYNGTEWKVATPGLSGKLEGVSCTAANACTAVGQAVSKIAVERWNGTVWSNQTTASPPSSPSIGSDVSCTSATACVAVGHYDSEGVSQPLAERWNGTSWALDSVPAPKGSTAATLLGVYCLTPTLCEASGSGTVSGVLGTLIVRYA